MFTENDMLTGVSLALLANVVSSYRTPSPWLSRLFTDRNASYPLEVLKAIDNHEEAMHSRISQRPHNSHYWTSFGKIFLPLMVSHGRVLLSTVSQCFRCTVHHSITVASLLFTLCPRMVSDDDALPFTHCNAPLPMHTMGECVSASVTELLGSYHTTDGIRIRTVLFGTVPTKQYRHCVL